MNPPHAKELASSPIVGLDVLRFVAALLVVMLHVWGSTAKPSEMAGWGGVGTISMWVAGLQIAPSAPFAPAFHFMGFLGVPIFFVISGAVIWLSAQGKSASEFAQGRLFRIIPALWIATVYSALVSLLFGAWSLRDAEFWRALLHSLFLLPVGPYVDGVIWTLVLEVIFYFSAVWLISKKRLDQMPFVYAGLGLVSLVYWSVVGLAGCIDAGNASGLCGVLRGQLANKIANLSLMSYGCFFSIGVLIAWAARTGRWGFALLMGLPALIAGCLNISTASSFLRYDFAAQGAQDLSVQNCLFFLFSVAFIGLSFLYRKQIFDFVGSNGAKVIRFVGLMTYPLYLVHICTGGIAIGLCLRLGLDATASRCVATLASMALAAVVAQWVEPFVRRTLKQFVVWGWRSLERSGFSPRKQ